MNKLTKEDLIKAAQERKKAQENAKLTVLVIGLSLVVFAMWGILFNPSVNPENYAIVMAIGAVSIGLSSVKG